VSENRFDDKAATWDDDPDKRASAQRAADAIRAAVALKSTDRLLEYGAGTALVSQGLQASVGPLTLVDSSAGMRDVLAQKIESGTIRNARVWDLDLAETSPPDETFDVIVTVMTMHHVADVGLVLSRLRALLAPDGRLCAVDLEAEDGSFHGDEFHGHHGFTIDGFAGTLSAAGFVGVHVDRFDEVMRDGRPYPVFLAVASQPASSE
jgi:ubiquinone/menaquinone biosynthesis C-methylase UbiE